MSNKGLLRWRKITKNWAGFSWTLKTLRTKDTIPSSLALTSASWAENRDGGHERSCIGSRTCSICADGSFGTSSFAEWVGAQQVPSPHARRNSWLHRRSTLSHYSSCRATVFSSAADGLQFHHLSNRHSFSIVYTIICFTMISSPFLRQFYSSTIPICVFFFLSYLFASFYHTEWIFYGKIEDTFGFTVLNVWSLLFFSFSDQLLWLDDLKVVFLAWCWNGINHSKGILFDMDGFRCYFLLHQNQFCCKTDSQLVFW